MKKTLALLAFAFMLTSCSPDSNDAARDAAPPQGSVQSGPGAVGQPVQTDGKKEIGSQPAGKDAAVPKVAKRVVAKAKHAEKAAVLKTDAAFARLRARMDRLEDRIEAWTKGKADPGPLPRSPLDIQAP